MFTSWAVAEPTTLDLWPGKPPGDMAELPPEADTTQGDGRLVAGRRVIRLGNVSTPQIAVYRPPAEKANGTAVVICPGGGHHILAYDLEGTEVAEWLNTLGVTGIVLKYRVPARDPQRRWFAAVQDAERAVSLVRAHASEWSVDPERIGIMGFSAGGETAARAALATERYYEPIDTADEQSHRPDFSILIYPAYLTKKDNSGLVDDVQVTKDSPPCFFVHAHDDRVTPLSSALLYAELKRQGVSAELHIYESGGHGYGLRYVKESPITTWPARCETWLGRQGLLAREE
ncbi:MAG: alpha/beta hydrolase [Planctomycetales bacterium]|nr:alpha/beta hydrolase [Planctomycetales bacterium]